MRKNKFKVWCKNKNEWEKDSIALYQDGSIYHTDLKGRHMYVSPRSHIIVFYTNLKDKNGVEIYEGDIVSSDIKHRRRYNVVSKKGCFMAGLDYLKVEVSIGAEVIGNIFENKELLNDKT